MENEEHASYLSAFCHDVYDSISKAVERKIHERSQTEVNLAVYEEVTQHVTFAKARCETFHGRKDELEKIRRYLEGEFFNILFSLALCYKIGDFLCDFITSVLLLRSISPLFLSRSFIY